MITYRFDVQLAEGPTSMYVLVPEADRQMTPELLADILDQAVKLPDEAEIVGISRVGIGVSLVGADGQKADLTVPDQCQREISAAIEDIAKYCGDHIVKGWKTGLLEHAAILSKWVPVV
jgi:pyridoxine 5'-phosphate synthase PdxJ